MPMLNDSKHNIKTILPFFFCKKKKEYLTLKWYGRFTAILRRWWIDTFTRRQQKTHDYWLLNNVLSYYIV